MLYIGEIMFNMKVRKLFIPRETEGYGVELSRLSVRPSFRLSRMTNCRNGISY